MMVPTNWNELSLSLKHSYFTHAADGGSDKAIGLMKSCLAAVNLQKTSTTEILAVVFNKQADSFFSGQFNQDASG